MKKIYLFLLALVCSVGMAWAVDQTKSFTWEASNTYSVSSNSFTADSVTWSFSASDANGITTAGQYIPTSASKSDNQYGLKFGNSGSAYYGTVTFTTDFFNNYNVKSVTMKVKNNGSKKGTLTATQGSVQIGTASHAATTNAWGSLTASGTIGNKGALTVTYEVAQASYVQSISVTYEIPTAPSVAYTVTFDANTNGTCGTASLTEASAGAGVTLPSCTANTGYTFLGWATTNDATVANAGKAGDKYNPAAAVTLYAVYVPVYAVTIETPSNGTLVVKNGENVVNNGDEVANGTTLNIIATPNRGYSFRNWQAVDGSTHTYTTTFTYDVASAVTIKANFDEIAKYTVTLGDDATELTPEYGGEAVVLPSRTGDATYTFAGWSETNVTVETTTNPSIIAAGAYIPSADVTLYPVFTRVVAGGSTDVPVTLTIADKIPAGTTTGTKITQFTADANVKATVAGGSNSGKVYETKSGNGIDQWRIYRADNPSGTLTITTTAGTLKTITVTYSNQNNGVMLKESTEVANNTEVDVTGETSVTFGVGGESEASKANGVIRVTEIAVVYTVEGNTTYYLSVLPTPAPAKTIDFYAAGLDGYYTTFSNDKAVTIPEMVEVGDEVAQLTVYTVWADGNELVLMDQTAYDGVWYLSENEGYLIKAEYTGDVTYTGEAAISVEYTELGYVLNGQDEDNVLRPASEAKDGGKKYYMLAYSNSSCTPASLGFYWGAANGAAFESRPNSAYLAIDADANLAPAHFLLENEEQTATSIENIEATEVIKFVENGQVLIMKNGVVYDVLGTIVR